MRNYETIFVVHPDLREEYVQSVVSAAADLIRRTGGEVLTLSDWGNKKLNYQIKHLTRGRYFHLHYTAGAATVNELERNLRISDRVFRYLSSRVDEEIEGARIEEASAQKLGTFDGIAPDFGSGASNTCCASGRSRSLPTKRKVASVSLPGAWVDAATMTTIVGVADGATAIRTPRAATRTCPVTRKREARNESGDQWW
ncbi:MAG: 30S ribosomal protein S6 [Deltaproteobacteria bacterium]|nr:30S ribosomal protein S6 [Deltaproteobacteria bacterium]